VRTRTECNANRPIALAVLQTAQFISAPNYFTGLTKNAGQVDIYGQRLKLINYKYK